jgi:mannose-6-phosphate isomerase-like protein (cupin superfamily)
MTQIAPTHTMHPVLPLHIELAWADFNEKVWDSQNGANYHYEFNMILRGWDNFLGTGISPNPHGGIGFLEYRNLMSNYGRYSDRNELGRQLNSWNFSAFKTKNHGNGFEPFFAVDYMDLHILKGGCGIGLHRHRDNQEMFLMMEGQGYMVIGDWYKMPQRERCFEIRTLRSGHFAMLKGGNLHALMNATDEDISLFMCGGYD